MQFCLDPQQCAAVARWAADIDRNVLEQQRQAVDPGDAAILSAGSWRPYYGAIGGELTYAFTPTSLGCIIKVKHSLTDEELDVTDYENW